MSDAADSFARFVLSVNERTYDCDLPVLPKVHIDGEFARNRDGSTRFTNHFKSKTA